MSKANPKQIIEGEIVDALELQQQLEKLENQLMDDGRFRQFMALREKVNTVWANTRKDIESVMVPAYKAGEIDKNVKGEWGSITVTESDQFEIDEKTLPSKFFKKVPDTSKIRATYHLEGKAPKGTTAFKKYGIMTRFNTNI
jgi:hypothetical protein